jgi:UDP-glucose 4-epimerase
VKILILGSEGFIGSNSVKYFTSQGHEVYKADIVIKEEENYTVINPEHADFSSLFSLTDYDVCINATGSANVQFSFTNPALDFSLNVVNVYLLLDAVRKYSPGCKFINVSSAAVYGNPKKLPVPEDVDLLPLSPYGMHKLYSEQICSQFYQHFNLPTTSVRIFSAYGEGQKKMLFYDLYKKLPLAHTDTITLYGTGNESRDFIHISDILSALDCIIKHGEFNGKAINIGSGIEYKISYAVELFMSNYEVQYNIQFNGKEKTGDPQNWCADISQLESYGFTPKVDLATGLKNYISWLQEKK